MSSGTPGGNWKNTGGNKPAGGGDNKLRRPWQPPPKNSKPTAAKKKSRTGRFLLAGLLTGTILALIIVVIYYWRPAKYPTLVVVGPSAGGSLASPENSAGSNSANQLAAWAKDGDNKPKLAAPAADTADKDAWKGKLDPDAKSLVLYFAAPGGADKDGPFLWFVPGDARRPDGSHKLRVKDILGRLEGMPKDQPKLLIFDAARMNASWPHGMLFNDFARALKELDGEIAKVPGLVVICSFDEDQRAWGSEEWRASVFGHFLLEGLKGAGGKQAGERITAAGAFDFASAETEKWAQANRDERQTPILLPKEKGRERAEALELASVPNEGYTTPAKPDAPAKVPADLEAAWENAAQLASPNRVPSPDILDPLRWREYLDLLVRWERLVRLGEDPESVRRQANVIADQLKLTHGASEPPCLAAAFPAGRALGVPGAKRDPAAFNKLWAAPTGTSRSDEWARQLGPNRDNETARRVVVAEMVIDRVLLDGPDTKTLALADDVLGTVDGPRVGTAEGHFLRILNRRLDPDKRPDVGVLRDAIKLRREAEETAWISSAKEGQHPYSETVFRWTMREVHQGDAERRLGEDLLFDVNPESWKKASEQYFPAARKHYAQAREHARGIAAGLQTRDKVFTRLPYYAKWLAADRKLPKAELDRLLGKAESAVGGAHQLQGYVKEGGGEDTLIVSAHFNEFIKIMQSVNADFDAITKAFETEVASFTNTVHPSNWHAIDNALSVPFIAAKDRVKLIGYVRDISFQLATKSEQPGGAKAPEFPAREMAQRQGRLAIALLGSDTHELQTLINNPNPNAWWQSYREAGERIGQRFQNLAAEIRTEHNAASAEAEYGNSAGRFQRASLLARLVDPAAALPASEDPLAVERRFRQHYFLLWRARQTILDGWANVNSTSAAPSWYALDATKLCLDTARPLALGSDPNLPPTEIERRLKALKEVEGERPVMLRLSAPDVSAVTDAPIWPFEFTLDRGSKLGIGFPVYWIAPPGADLLKPDPAQLGRKLEPRLGKDVQARQQFQFAAVPQKEDSTAAGQFVTTVLYRGQLYDKTTVLRPAGSPTRTLVYTPPKGDAAFYVIADRKAVAGAVTILIDRSGSMTETPNGATRTKFQQVYDAIETILDDLPAGTTLTIAGFYGDPETNGTPRVAPAPGGTKILWRGDQEQRKAVLAAVNAMAPVPRANTPLGISIARILSKEDGSNYWPPAASGVRTLIVLTDGADVSDDKNPGNTTLKALLNTPEDTALHMVLFALNKEEQKESLAQFRVTADKPSFRESGRTPAVLYPDVADAKGVADAIREAMRPRIYYRREETANDSKAWNRLIVTLPGEPKYRPSLAVPPGEYDLRGLRNPQRVQLDPGDRIVLRSRQLGDKFDLFVPSFAFDKAGAEDNSGRLRNESKGVRMTLQELRVTGSKGSRIGQSELDAIVTLEAATSDETSRLLKLPRPDFAWFDVNSTDGKEGDAALRKALTITNRSSLVAPAWNIHFAGWDRNVADKLVRRPAVTSFWIEGYPAPAGRYSLDLNNLAAAGKEGDVLADGLPVERPVFTFEPPVSKDLPEGEYLTIRLGYRDPTKPVLLRPGKLKGTEQRFKLHELHQYYEPVGRYTVQFGPITPADKNAPVELELFSVTDLRKRASDTGRSVSISYPAERPLNADTLTDKLLLIPDKE